MQYSLNEICLLPSAYVTDITSRRQVNPLDENGNLPVFVAPMTSVINEENFGKFQEANVIPILPRNCTETRGEWYKAWHSYSLQEFEELVNSPRDYNGYKILIDVANGHMKKIYDLVREAKSKWPNIVIMVGNIAHPGIYIDCCLAGVDYVRVGIGGGCFVPGQPVKTKRGLVNIEEIQLGDEVLTHTGEYHKVVDLLTFESNDVYEVNGIKCTGNHEFYVINSTDIDKVTEENLSEYAFWVQARNLDLNKHCLVEL